MASPVASSYSVAAGLPIYAGRVRSGFVGGAALARTVAGGVLTPNPSAFAAGAALGRTVAGGVMSGLVAPAWLAGQPLNTWFQIPNTNGRVTTATVLGATEPVLTGGDSWLDAWGAFTVIPDSSELIVPPCGGHEDSSDNRVAGINLESDTPTWRVRCQPSPVGIRTRNETDGWWSDDKPAARHVYDNVFFLPSTRRMMLIGGRVVYGDGGPETPAIQGYNVDTDTWDPPATYPSVRQSGGTFFGVVCNQRTGDFFSITLGGVSDRYRAPATVSGTNLGTYTNASVTGFSAVTSRWPVAWDSVRQECFLLNWGNGEGDNSAGLGLLAYRWSDTGGGAAQAITFNASAAYSALLAATPQYAAMSYDPDNQRYLFMHGGEVGKVYVITPNASTTWDVSVLSTSGTPTAPPGAGINGRFKYVPRLKGFVMLPRANSNLWFLRTA